MCVCMRMLEILPLDRQRQEDSWDSLARTASLIGEFQAPERPTQ